jgi:hypothetical protein
LLFAGGWDLWVQTLTHLLTIFLFAICVFTDMRTIPAAAAFQFSILLLGLVIAQVNSTTSVTSLITFYNYINYLLIFVLAASYFSAEKFQDIILKTFVYISITTGILDIVYPIIFKSSLFPNPNIKVGFLLLAIPIYFDIILNNRFGFKNIKKHLLSILFLPVLYSFLSANSDWGNIVLLFSLLLYFTVVKKTKKWPYILMLLIIMLSLFYVFRKPSIDIIDRVLWIKSGIAMFFKKPLTGFGPGSTPHILPIFIKSNRYSLYIHSYFIQFAAENGIISLIGLILIFFKCINLLLNTSNFRSKVVAVSALSLIIYNLFEYNLTIPLISLSLWFLFGSFSNLEVVSINIKNTLTKHITRSILSILLIMAAITSVKPFISTRYFTKGIYSLRIMEFNDAEMFFRKSLKIYPDYHLPQIGLALKSIYTGDMINAKKQLLSCLPVKKGNPLYVIYKEGEDLLMKNKLFEAKIKFLEVIRLRLTQYGLNPNDYMTPLQLNPQ